MVKFVHLYSFLFILLFLRSSQRSFKSVLRSPPLSHPPFTPPGVMAAPVGGGLVGVGVPAPSGGGRLVVPCSSARLNSILSPRPSLTGQRGIIVKHWPSLGHVTMGLILKISVLLGPIPSLSTKLEAGKHNSLVMDFLRAGWPENADFWDSISTVNSRLSEVQSPGAPVVYDGSASIWSPGVMIFKDICKVKQEPAVNEALFRSNWFSKDCPPGERAVLQGLAKTLRELAPSIGLVVEPPSVEPDVFWLVVRPRVEVAPVLRPSSSLASASSGMSLNDHILNMVGGSASALRTRRVVSLSVFEGLRDRSETVGYFEKRSPGTWEGTFASCVDLECSVEEMTKLAMAALKARVSIPAVPEYVFNVLGEDVDGCYPSFVHLGSWTGVVRARRDALVDDATYARAKLSVFDRDWLGRTADGHPFTSICMNHHVDVALATVGPLVTVDAFRHSRSSSATASDLDVLRNDVSRLRAVLGKSEKAFSSSCLEDVEDLRTMFEKLAVKVNRLACSEKARKRAKVSGLCVDAVGDLVPFGIVAGEVFGGGESDSDSDREGIVADIGAGGEVSDQSSVPVGGGRRILDATVGASKRKRGNE